MRNNVIFLAAVAAMASIMATAPVMAEESYSVSYGSSRADAIIDGIDFGEGYSFGESFAETKEPTTIYVSADASVYAKADMASVELEFNQDEVDSAKAMEECSKRVEKTEEVLYELGLSKSDITTLSTNVRPRYDQGMFSESKIVGYTANIVIKISNQSVDEIGRIISNAMEAGADEVGSLSFYCSDYDEKYDEALQLAVKAARGKAEAMAKAEGMNILRAKNISEGYQDTSYRYKSASSSYADMEMNTFAEVDWDVPISAGDAEIKANVTVLFEAK